MIDNEQIADGILGFHAQQTVEKSLKGVLALRGVHYEYRHDIDYLRRLLAEHGEQLPEALAEADTLTPWAMELRYEEPPDAPVLDRTAALELAAAALGWAQGLVDPDS